MITPYTTSKVSLASIQNKYEYDYGLGVDLQPGTKLHDDLRDEILVRAEEAREVMQRKAERWAELEKLMAVYVDLDATERAIKKKNERKPLPIVIPAAFAMVETNMSFLVKAFLDSMPVHGLQPRSSEDTYGTILLEMLLDWQTQTFSNDLAHYRAFRDAQVYGFGVSVFRWAEKWGWRPGKPSFEDTVLYYADPNYRPDDVWDMLYEGNEAENIDPRLYWPDPNVPIDKPQRAEFISWMEITNTTNLLELERDGFLFNCKYAAEIDCQSRLMDRNKVIENVIRAGNETNATNRLNPAHVLWMTINLVPKRWGLGFSEYPEKWVFALAGDEVIVQARPMGLRHNCYPVAVAAPDSTGRDVTPLSRLELAQGLQQYIDWMMAAYMEAQRVDINGRFLIDPSLINMHDLADTERRFIRARRSQWGKGRLADAMTQLQTTGNINNNIPAAATMMQFLKETTGAVDNMQGILQTRGGDRSATEAKAANMGALSKLERMAWMLSRQYMRSAGYLMASQTQQLLSRTQYLRIVGAREQELRSEYGLTDPSVLVDPLQLAVDFDVVVQDNTIPTGDFADSWMQVFQATAANPTLQQIISLPRVFLHLARILGAKNLQGFMQSKNVVPLVADNSAVLAQAQAGNLVPVQEMANG